MADDTAERVLAAAREAFAREGYAGATTRTIAAAARVNVATLAYHFGGKDGLYRAVLDKMYAEMLAVVPPADLGGDPASRIRATVRELWRFALAHEPDIRLLLRQLLDRDPHRAEVATRWTPEAAAAGTRLLAALQLPPRPPRETMLALVSLNHLLARYATTPPEDRRAMFGPDADEIIVEHLSDVANRLLG